MNQGMLRLPFFFGSSNKEPDVLAVLEHQYDVQDENGEGRNRKSNCAELHDKV